MQVELAFTSADDAPNKAKNFFTPKVLAFLQKNAPVGCRDTHTLNLMKSQGVDAYFSGCLTLTLEPNPAIEKRSYILCVDASDAVTDMINRISARPVFELTPMWHAHNTVSERVSHAKIYLKKNNKPTV
jgi:hypothetical protein